MARKQFILVAGVDFVNFELDFGALCQLRVNDLIADHKGTADLRFKIFDVRRGTITIIEVTAAGKRIPPVVDGTDFREITKKDYPGFKKGELLGNLLKKTVFRVMSITDVYREVISLGKSFPGELIELSFFTIFSSHRIPLVNSPISDGAVHGNKAAFKKLPKGSRDPDDPDGEFNLDFKPPRMGREDLSHFQAAFHPDGYAWIWGNDRGFLSDGLLEFLDFALRLKELDDPSSPDDLLIGIPGTAKPESKFLLFWVEWMLSLKDYRASGYKVPLKLIRYLVCHYASRPPAVRLKQAANLKKVYGTFRDFVIDFDPGNKRLPEVAAFQEAARLALQKRFKLRSAPQGNYTEFGDTVFCPLPYFDANVYKPKKKKPGAATSDQPSSQPASQPASLPKPAPPAVPFTSDSPLLKPTHPMFRLNAYARHYIFVAGVDYKSSGANFLQLCMNRVDHLIARDDNRDTMLFQVLDVGSGQVIFVEVKYETGTIAEEGFVKSIVNAHASVKKTTDDLVRFEQVKNNDAHYEIRTNEMGDRERFFRGTQGAMPAAEMYRRVIALGEKCPGRLMELGFFTHGTEAGPRPLNFPEELEISGVPVDPLAFDPSPLDFDLLPGEAEQAAFRDAFHPGGYSWTWGYDSDPELRKLLKALLDSKEYKAGGLTEDTIITLKNPTPRLRLFAQRVAGLLPKRKVPPLKIEMPFGRLLRFFAAVIKSSYMYHLARETGKDVFGALPGTAAGPESGTLYPLMRVDPAYAKYSGFFQTHFGFESDPEKRGYGKYIPDFPWDDSDLAGVKIGQQVLEEVKEFPVEAE